MYLFVYIVSVTYSKVGIRQSYNAGTNSYSFSSVCDCVGGEWARVLLTGRAKQKASSHAVGQLDEDHVRECLTLGLKVLDPVFWYLCSRVFARVHNGGS